MRCYNCNQQTNEPFCPACGYLADPLQVAALRQIAAKLQAGDPSAPVAYVKLRNEIGAMYEPQLRQELEVLLTGGATDAGATDAGATDAGATDAGATDAGANHAGANHAGATHAGDGVGADETGDDEEMWTDEEAWALLDDSFTSEAALVAAAATTDVPATKSSERQASERQSAADKSLAPNATKTMADVAATPQERVVPAATVQTIYLDFNHQPDEIVHLMGQIEQEVARYRRQNKAGCWFVLLLLPLGLFFPVADLLFGYNLFTFSLLGVALWGAALIGLIALWRQAKPPELEPRFFVAREILRILADDGSEKRPLTGWLDLSGTQKKSNLYQSKKSASGQPIEYYRDEWFRFKMRLYDGNVLRLSLTEKRKVRRGYFKRGSSGKHKWRGMSKQRQHQLKVTISADTDAFTIQPFASKYPKLPDSDFATQETVVEPGYLLLQADYTDINEYKLFAAKDVLAALQFCYQQVEQKG